MPPRGLALIKPLLKFQSAIWGSGRLTNPGIQPHRVHLNEIDPDGLIAWKQINRQDKVIPIAAANRGRKIQFHAPTLFSSREDAVMRDCAERYGRQNYLITAFERETPSVMGWILKIIATILEVVPGTNGPEARLCLDHARASVPWQPVIEKILTHLGLQARAPPRAPARRPQLQAA